jgi:hypothetical protein
LDFSDHQAWISVEISLATVLAHPSQQFLTPIVSATITPICLLRQSLPKADYGLAANMQSTFDLTEYIIFRLRFSFVFLDQGQSILKHILFIANKQYTDAGSAVCFIYTYFSSGSECLGQMIYLVWYFCPLLNLFMPSSLANYLLKNQICLFSWIAYINQFISFDFAVTIKTNTMADIMDS